MYLVGFLGSSSLFILLLCLSAINQRMNSMLLEVLFYVIYICYLSSLLAIVNYLCYLLPPRVILSIFLFFPVYVFHCYLLTLVYIYLFMIFILYFILVSLLVSYVLFTIWSVLILWMRLYLHMFLDLSFLSLLLSYLSQNSPIISSQLEGSSELLSV